MVRNATTSNPLPLSTIGNGSRIKITDYSDIHGAGSSEKVETDGYKHGLIEHLGHSASPVTSLCVVGINLISCRGIHRTHNQWLLRCHWAVESERHLSIGCPFIQSRSRGYVYWLLNASIVRQLLHQISVLHGMHLFTFSSSPKSKNQVYWLACILNSLNLLSFCHMSVVRGETRIGALCDSFIVAVLLLLQSLFLMICQCSYFYFSNWFTREISWFSVFSVSSAKW